MGKKNNDCADCILCKLVRMSNTELVDEYNKLDDPPILPCVEFGDLEHRLCGEYWTVRAGLHHRVGGRFVKQTGGGVRRDLYSRVGERGNVMLGVGKPLMLSQYNLSPLLSLFLRPPKRIPHRTPLPQETSEKRPPLKPRTSTLVHPSRNKRQEETRSWPHLCQPFKRRSSDERHANDLLWYRSCGSWVY